MSKQEGIGLSRQQDETLHVDLVTLAAHELRTPLVMMNGYLELLSDNPEQLSEQQRRYIERMQAGSVRLNQLVESLLLAGKYRHGQWRADIRPICMADVCEEVLRELEPRLEQQNLSLKINRKRKLPLVLADTGFLYQVLFNILDNAIKYSQPGSKIRVSILAKGEHATVEVRDYGIGVSQQSVKKLFRKFATESKPVEDRVGSSGLGLYITRQLVEAQDGQVSLQSLRDGTRCTVSLPIMRQLSLL